MARFDQYKSVSLTLIQGQTGICKGRSERLVSLDSLQNREKERERAGKKCSAGNDEVFRRLGWDIR